MNNLTFGPITSRRFGTSLGIDLSPDKKQCNFDCVYCELKGAKPVGSIVDAPLVKDIIASVEEALAKYDDIDVITLTANGEPTLYPYLEELVDALNQIKTTQKLLILSNGATINDPVTCKALEKIDIVKLSLDCVSERCFKRIDRPLKGISVDALIQGMKRFKQLFKGELVLEVLVVEGINDTEEEFLLLNDAMKMIAPHRVDVGTIDRPPAYAVKGVSYDRLEALARFIETIPVSVASKRVYSESKKTFTQEELLSTLAKRPQSVEDVTKIFDVQTQKRLEVLVEEGKVTCRNVAGVTFYQTRER